MSSVGIDLVDCRRIEKIVEKTPNFAKKLLSTEELAYLSNKSVKTSKNNEIAPYFQTLAGFYAAKEAVLKALGIGFTKGILFNEIEVLHYESGAPYLKLNGKMKNIFDNKNFKNLSVSISHDFNVAVAIVSLD